MVLVICPGVHSPAWTTQFLYQLDKQLPEGRAVRLVFPAHRRNPWSPYELRTFLDAQAIAQETSFVFIAFSAGCVAAVGTAWYWAKQQNRQTSAIIALDGWGVPTTGPFVSYRLSHDAFTHQTSTCLEAVKSSFYADPAISHQQLWCNPAEAAGWQMRDVSAFGKAYQTRHTTALQFLVDCIRQHPHALVSTGEV